MTVEESPASHILTGQTNWNTFIYQRGVGQVFSAAPVKLLVAFGHFVTVSVNLSHAGLHFNGFRYVAYATRQFLQTLRFDLVRILFIPFVIQVRRPGEGMHVVWTPFIHHA